MTRTDPTDRLTALSAKSTEMAAKILLDAISTTPFKGGAVKIWNFGSFFLNSRRPRNRWNPKTGVKVQVPTRYVPHFNVGKELRERVG